MVQADDELFGKDELLGYESALEGLIARLIQARGVAALVDCINRDKTVQTKLSSAIEEIQARIEFLRFYRESVLADNSSVPKTSSDPKTAR